MPTQTPDLAAFRAQPDAPITAGAWNALRAAILNAYTVADELATRQGTISVIVRERASDALLPAAQIQSVIAQPEGQPDSEIPVVRLGARYFVGPLAPGVYRVKVTPTADTGLLPQTRLATVLSGKPTEVTFFLAPPIPGKVATPALFGLTLQEALNLLEAAELRPGRVMDSHGNAVTITNTGRLGGGYLATDPLQAGARVLNADPDEGQELDRGGLVNLLIAAQRVIPPVERVRLDMNLHDGSLEVLLFDPVRASNPSEFSLVRQLFRGLVALGPDGNAVPGLAERWEVDEAGAVWTFTLRAGLDWARFDPAVGIVAAGPLTAEDAAFALQRALDPATEAPWRDLIGIISGAEALDDRTLQITLAGPTTAMPGLLAHPITFPVPRAAVETFGPAWTDAEHILFSGPYALTERNATHFTLQKNPLWHAAETVLIEEIRFLRIADESAALDAFITGALDTVRVPPMRLDEVSSDGTLEPLMHFAQDQSTWLTRPWLTRDYPMPGEEQIDRWELDWNAKKAAQA